MNKGGKEGKGVKTGSFPLSRKVRVRREGPGAKFQMMRKNKKKRVGEKGSERKGYRQGKHFNLTMGSE